MTSSLVGSEMCIRDRAKAALDKEWDRLRSISTWNENEVYEWSEVASRARNSSTQAHMGRIFAIL
eukprot:1004588-Prorocentrum_lima.AAC.1